MSPQRFIPLLLGGSLLFVLLLGFWLRDFGGDEAARLAAATPSPRPTPTAQAAKSGEDEMPRHRLAGTVVGDARYAVVELPDGTNDLYRPGQEVPGLGKLLEVEANRATFEGANGRIDLPLVAAPTETPVLLLRDTPATAVVTPVPASPSPPSPTASGSSSSNGPGRSAS